MFNDLNKKYIRMGFWFDSKQLRLYTVSMETQFVCDNKRGRGVHNSVVYQTIFISSVFFTVDIVSITL